MDSKEETTKTKEVKVSLSDGRHVVIPMNEVVFQEYDYQDMMNKNSNKNSSNGTGTNGKVVSSKSGSPPTGNGDTSIHPSIGDQAVPNVDVDSEIQSIHSGSNGSNVSALGNTDPAGNESTIQQPTQSRVAFVHDNENPEDSSDQRERSREFERVSAKKWMEKFEEKKQRKKEEEAKKIIGSRLAARFRARKKVDPVDEASTTDEAILPPVPDTKNEETKEVSQDVTKVAKTEETKVAKTEETKVAKAEEKKVAKGSETKETETKDSEKDQHMKKAVKKVQPKLGVMKRKGAPPILSLPGGDHPGEEEVSSDDSEPKTVGTGKEKPVTVGTGKEKPVTVGTSKGETSHR